MIVELKAHFDGKVIVPDEETNLPVNSGLRLVVTVEDGNSDKESEEWMHKFQLLLSLAVHAPVISDEGLRRENIYNDRL